MVVCIVLSLANLAAGIYMVSLGWEWAFSTKPWPAPDTLPFLLLSMMVSSLTSVFVVLWSTNQAKTIKRQQQSLDSDIR